MRGTQLNWFWMSFTLFLGACTREQANLVSIEEMLRSHGQPIVVASEFEVNRDSPLLSVSLFGVNKPVSGETGRKLSHGQVLAFSSDQRLVQQVAVHFEDMREADFIGWSSFASLLRDETKLTIFSICEGGRAKMEFSEYVIVVNLVVATRDGRDDSGS